MGLVSRAGRTAKLQLQSPLELAIRGTLRHWILLSLALIAAVLAGLYAVDRFGKKRYSYQGKLFYSPNRVTEPYYVSPSLRDLQLAIVETPFLQSLHQEFEVDEDFKVFAYRIGFDVNGSSSLDVSYTGRDPDHTQSLVQGSMQRFIERGKQLRRKSLSGYVDDFDRDIADTSVRYESSRDKLAETLRPLGILSDESLIAEINRLREAATSYQSNLDSARMRRDLSEAQVASLATMNDVVEDEDGQTREDQTQSSDPEPTKDGDPGANRNQSLATYDTQMQKLLEDRIRRERENSSLQLQIDLKEKEFDRSQSSFQRDLISEAAFEKVKGELQLLKAQKSSRIRELESQLSQINGRINDRTESLSVLDPATAATLMTGAAAGNLNLEAQTMALLRGSRTAAELNIEQIEAAMVATKSRLEMLAEGRAAAQPLIAQVELAAAELEELRHIKDEFSRAQNSTQAELSIAQDATRLLEGEKNNYTKWFVAAALATLGLVVGPIFGLEFLKSWKHSPTTSSVLGLPVLGQKPPEKMASKDPQSSDESLQRLSLRIANAYNRRDGVLTIAGGVDGNENDDLIRTLADHYRQSGATVSVVDAIDLVPSSEASTIASTWISDAKSGSGLTIVRAPLMAKPLAGDTAAANSDAIVLLTSTKQASDPLMQQRVSQINELGGKVIGVVLA